MANSGFVEYVIDLLSGYGNINSRRMFGGYGLYCNKIIFAIIIDDELYFKADDGLAEEYKHAGSFPFTYQKNEKTVALSYWYVPAEIIENEDLLKNWFEKSLRVANDKKDKHY
jgi:DNA transformation protein and related proteins